MFSVQTSKVTTISIGALSSTRPQKSHQHVRRSGAQSLCSLYGDVQSSPANELPPIDNSLRRWPRLSGHLDVTLGAGKFREVIGPDEPNSPKDPMGAMARRRGGGVMTVLISLIGGSEIWIRWGGMLGFGGGRPQFRRCTHRRRRGFCLARRGCLGSGKCGVGTVCIEREGLWGLDYILIVLCLVV